MKHARKPLSNSYNSKGLWLRLRSGGSRRSTRNVLVFDLGGGTLDTVLLQHTMTGRDEAIVKNIDGDMHLGGQDWDGRLMRMALEVISELLLASISRHRLVHQYANAY